MILYIDICSIDKKKKYSINLQMNTQFEKYLEYSGSWFGKYCE